MDIDLTTNDDDERIYTSREKNERQLWTEFLLLNSKREKKRKTREKMKWMYIWKECVVCALLEDVGNGD